MCNVPVASTICFCASKFFSLNARSEASNPSTIHVNMSELGCHELKAQLENYTPKPSDPVTKL
jgi:hypothetical protein